MKDNILCFSSYKLRKEKKENHVNLEKEPPPRAPHQSPEEMKLRILNLRKRLDDLEALMTSL